MREPDPPAPHDIQTLLLYNNIYKVINNIARKRNGKELI